MDLIKVSASCKPKSLAGALSFALQKEKKAVMQAVGAGAINQAVKAIAIARGFMAPNGVNLVMYPEFAEIEIGSEQKTAIKIIVESR